MLQIEWKLCNMLKTAVVHVPGRCCVSLQVLGLEVAPGLADHELETVKFPKLDKCSTRGGDLCGFSELGSSKPVR